MKIGIIGTGMVGRAFATRFSGLGHDVVIGTRDIKNTLSRTEPDAKGNPPFSTWIPGNEDISVVTFAEAAAHGDVVINATEGVNSLSALEIAGANNLAGKVVLDLALPLSYTPGRPPHLSFANDDSLGEQIQRLLPDSDVVKTLNTMSFVVMLDPGRLPGIHHVFVSGNSQRAKKIVGTLLSELGWVDEAVIDLGDIITARGTEMYANLLFHIADVKKNYDFNIALVSPAERLYEYS